MPEEARGAARAAAVALAGVWTDHRRRLYVLCLRWMSGSREDAEDALGRAFIRALEDHGRGDGEVANYPAWLTRLAQNACMDLHRERAARRRAAERYAAQLRLDAQSAESPEAARLHRELGDELRRAIAVLPPRLAEPTRRRFVDDMPYEHIAEELSVTNETVRKRIQEARSILSRRLGRYLREGAIEG